MTANKPSIPVPDEVVETDFSEWEEATRPMPPRPANFDAAATMQRHYRLKTYCLAIGIAATLTAIIHLAHLLTTEITRNVC